LHVSAPLFRLKSDGGQGSRCGMACSLQATSYESSLKFGEKRWSRRAGEIA
jgi:hypothetical protein